jgi:S-DNA-T family DNA segregation ATPase FtsK/SpoIIIE
MPAKRRSRKSKQHIDVDKILSTAARPEVLGVLLVLISIFTLLSLITPGDQGTITYGWVEFLKGWVGMGVWGLPLVTGALGLWVVICAIERMPDLPWQRPAGSALLLLAYILAVTLLIDQSPFEAGGRVGVLLVTVLDSLIGRWGVWSLVTLLFIAGLVLLTDRLLLDLAVDAAFLLQEWWDNRRARVPAPLQPMLPVPTGIVPWWKRLSERLRPHPSFQLPAAPNLVTPMPRPTAPEIERTARPASSPPPATDAPRLARTTPLRGEGDILTPRIVGGAQDWRLPRLAETLNDWERQVDSDDLIRKQGRLIQETLGLFGVPADFEGAYKGPSVTQYLIKPGYVERTIRGETQRVKVKVSKIAALANDLALALAAASVRIEAPIPGTNYVGVEVPNQESNIVGLKELMESDAFQNMKGKLRIALGEDVKGQPIVADLAKMPHLLIAGATGSGKSVCINSIIACLLLTHTPDTLRLLMVDPKMVELSTYNGIPHLLSPVVTELDRAAGVLFWAVKEMERRYQLCSKANARDLERYNQYLIKRDEKPLPYIVVVVDEMADLMMAAPEEVEKHICRLAQMARAVGIHLIIATQRPSVDVITGLIKANFPARIAFAVTSQVDSRVILDVPGAERLLGRGDMLFMAADASKLERIQGTYLSDEEISRVVRYWKGIHSFETAPSSDGPASAAQEPASSSDAAGPSLPSPNNPAATGADPLRQPPLFSQIEELKAKDARDELFDEAVAVVTEAGRGSVSLLQRKLRIGYSRASRLVDQLEAAGILGDDLGGNHGRAVLTGDDTPTPPGVPKGHPPLGAPRIIGGADDEEPPPAARPRVWM